MSEMAGQADKLVHAEITAIRAKIQHEVKIQPTGFCLLCSGGVAEQAKFCHVDYEAGRAAFRRIGQYC